MYKVPNYSNTSLIINQSLEGETIEQKIVRIMDNKEPIKDGAPIIYTDRKDGVKSAYNIRTDRFDIAIEAMDVVHRTDIARRDNRGGADAQLKKVDGEAKPIPTNGTEGT